MFEVQPVQASGSWPSYLLLLIAATCFVVGIRHAYLAFWLWRRRNTPISDPMIANVLEGVRPPPFAQYAAWWCAAGIAAVLAAIAFTS